MKKWFALFLLLLSAAAIAGPPYDITVTFDSPTTGGTPDGYRFYIDDCAATGPTGAPFATVTSGQTFTGALTADGTYEMCVRPYNAAGETPDPGTVATVTVADVPLPGAVDNFTITVVCPSGACTVTVTY